MLITSVMLATKFFDDETFNNLYYAKVGGLQVNELNQLEEKFLSLIQFSLTIQKEVFDRYRCELVKHAKASGVPKVTMHIPPHNKVCNDLRSSDPSKSNVQPSCQARGSLSRSASSAAISTRANIAPSAPQAPSLVRSVCEALIVESVQNKNLQSQLISRVTELLNAEEKLHHKIPPSSVKTLCAKLVSENNMSPSLVVRASLQAERLERLEKMESMWYQGGAASSMGATAESGEDSKVNNNNNNNNNGLVGFGNLTINNNSGSNSISSNSNKGIAFSQCTPSYPSNNRHHMVAVSWG